MGESYVDIMQLHGFKMCVCFTHVYIDTQTNKQSLDNQRWIEHVAVMDI